MNKRSKTTLSLFGCSAIGLLSGCMSSGNDGVNDTINKNAAERSPENVQEIVKNEHLAIDSQKCIGCGKCARIAPKNFAMKTDERKAEVISDEIISQRNIDRVIDVCPTKAITQ